MQGSRITDYPEMPFLWKLENIYLAGHPSMSAVSDLASKGLKTIVNIRQDGEQDYTELVEFCKTNSIEYYHLPIMSEAGLDAQVCSEVSAIIKDNEDIMIHCASANRVGGWLITHLVIHRGIEFDDAIEIAMQNGLTNPGFISQAQRIIDLKA